MPNVEYYQQKYASGEEVLHSYKLRALEQARGLKPGRALDLGCGSGVMASRLKEMGHEVYGIDISSNAIQKLRERGIEGQTANLEEALPLSDAEFDLVWCTELLEHVANPTALLTEIRRVLKPGGRLLLTTPNSAHIAYRLLHLLGKTCSEVQHSEHLRFFSAASLKTLLEQTGFTINSLTGRNLYIIVPFSSARELPEYLDVLGIRFEYSHAHDRPYLIWEHFTGLWNTLWADTFIVSADKRA
ncbi:MAG: class I SAM-dependent methyltransferase [Candidatus Omnitrophica bacterium]|nr:class I SAM-dependent methyltransferase [Candidatus Omnitrophota bacterium]